MTTYDGLPLPQRYWSAATIWLALILAVLDSSIANVALPSIARDLSAPASVSVWVINAYQLVIVIALLPLATLGEMFGYRHVFQIGIVLFSAASLACSFAHSLPALAAARAVQGIGAACIMAQNGALVRYTYPLNLLGRGVGINALVVSAAAALGPPIAAIILSIASWQWLFAVNVPIGVLTFILGRTSLPESPRSGALDFIGAGMNVLMFGCGFVGIDAFTRHGLGWSSGSLLAVAIAAGVALVWRSRTEVSPIIPLDLLRNHGFAMSVVTSVASFSAQTLAFVSLPFYFEGILHRDQVATGLLMTPWPVAVGLGAPIAGRLADKWPASILSSVGLLVLAAGLASLALLPTQASAISIIWRMALCGLGFGFFQAPNNRMLLSSAPMARSGAAGGMLATARLTGQTAGATIAAICLRLSGGGETTGLLVASLLAVGAALASVTRSLKRETRRKPDQGCRKPH
ncbi:MFS transporter [uncultured Methylovirgula sp.]|uniref:MFS transporter n=1 Tax=uncultured Methylovirgula sp. TaxID=1285960 RepID=UPI00263896C9|nr:MFS transporter [uncultured Methylovirgula sp.]